ncbi:signal transduction histidine kinase [Oleiphilus messinensis]|uniref:Signal transduction histidine kinase n=1 Tax=Oleiphilus messinensis TaxID=141451 RepID=A0A1Y0I6H0_9GAMM|nr:histidine kinase [Oleiphilus messinensis]ARU55386.1 signal transduction histidine kinase [Oleiphilus messinensis]
MNTIKLTHSNKPAHTINASMTVNTWINPVERLVAITTWALVLGFSCYVWIGAERPDLVIMVLGWGTYPLLGVCALLCLWPLLQAPFALQANQATPLQRLSLWGGLVGVTGLMLLVLINVTGIMLVLLFSRLLTVFSIRQCVIVALAGPLFVSVYYFLLEVEPGFFPVFNGLLYGMFNLFVLFVTTRVIAEREAKEYAALLVSELKSTQHLLAVTAKRDERIRIARDLHDMLGHHLAALSLELEVASHSEAERAKVQIKKAQSIARILLGDIRAVVTTFRENQNIDLREALETLLQALPGLKVFMEFPPSLPIEDARVAEVILRCCQEALTNTLKHSRATEAIIVLRDGNNGSDDQACLHLSIQDNGGKRGPIVPGNGLTGMGERVATLLGECRFSVNQQGFCIEVSIPRQGRGAVGQEVA